MSRITIRPAQGYDFNTLQAMSCNGGDGPSCYPSFNMAGHKFFVAADQYTVVGFICAHPSQAPDNTRFVQLLEPFVYSRLLNRGIEDDLKVAVLEWAEQKLDIHFFMEDPLTLHPIKPHEYLRSLKYDLPDMIANRPADLFEQQANLEPQGVSTPAQASAPAWAPA